MKDNLETSCARADELVTYLYGEASASVAADFERHMKECAACTDELAAFRVVREGVVEWRNQSLPSFDAQPSAAPVLSGTVENMRERRRSAVAALREFFALSPVWMRAGTVAIAAIVCALVVFAATRMFTKPEMVVVERIVNTGPTESEIQQRVKRELEELRRKEEQKALQAQTENGPATEVAKDSGAVINQKAKKRSGPSSSSVARREKRETPDKVYASQEVRQQLAEMVQSAREEDQLPKLSDLIDDSSDN